MVCDQLLPSILKQTFEVNFLLEIDEILLFYLKEVVSTAAVMKFTELTEAFHSAAHFKSSPDS